MARHSTHRFPTPKPGTYPLICKACQHDDKVSKEDALACPCWCHETYKRFNGVKVDA